MYLSMFVLFLTLSLLFIIPVEYLSISGLYISSLMLVIKQYRKEIVLLDWTVFLVYLIMSIVYYLVAFENIIPYMGTFFYASISLTSIVGSFVKKPFTLVNNDSVSEQDMYYHRVLSFIMGIMYIPAFVLSITLFPSSSYIYIPIIISIVSIPLSIRLAKAFIYMRPVVSELYAHKNNREVLGEYFDNTEGMYKIDGNYIGKEVVSNEDKAMFLEVLKRKYYELYNQSKLKSDVTYNEFFQRIVDEYEDWSKTSSAFVVINMKTKQGIGAIRLVYDKNKLPLESFLPVSLTKFRKKNIYCAEAGRLAIVGVTGMQRGKVFAMLHYLIGSKLFTKNIEILFTSAVQWQVSFYKKLNFDVIGDAYEDKETLTQDYVCCLNIPYDNKNSQTIVKRQDSKLVSFFENYYNKKIYLKHYFSSYKTWKNRDVTDLIFVKEVA